MRLSASSHLAIAIFCWLPPEKAPTRVQSARWSTSTRSKTPLTASVSRLASISPPRLKRSITGSETLCLPVSLRNSASVLRSSGTRLMPMFGADRIERRGDRHRPAVDPELALGDLAHAEAGEEEVELAHALEPGDAEDLALVEREGGVPELLAGREVVDREDLGRVARADRRTRRKGLGERAADDHLDDLARR